MPGKADCFTCFPGNAGPSEAREGQCVRLGYDIDSKETARTGGLLEQSAFDLTSIGTDGIETKVKLRCFREIFFILDAHLKLSGPWS